MTPPEIGTKSRTSTTRGSSRPSRTRMQFDIWKFPFEQLATDNVRDARGHHPPDRTGMTPTAAPDGDQIAFLSDSGGHGNLWVISTRSREVSTNHL